MRRQKLINMSYRYIFDATEPKKSQSDVMLDKVWQKIRENIRGKYESGTLALTQMCQELGDTQLKYKHDRLLLPYNFLNDLAKKTEEGTLTLVDSSWGDRELKEKNLEGTCPTANDMHVDSCGYGNYGGPTYDITLSADEIVVKANSAYQQFDSWDTIDCSFHWQTRTFVFKYADGDNAAVYEAILSHYADKIIKKYTDAKYRTAFDQLVDNLATSIIGNLNNLVK